MALPIILGIGAAIAAAAGVGAGVNGGLKMKDANDTMALAQRRHDENIKHFESANASTSKAMDKVGKIELEILNSFEDFSTIWEKIHNKPEFRVIDNSDVKITEYSAEELNKVSVGAGVLLGGLGGAAVGTAGGFAAAGATTSAVMAIGTASTGTAISTLSGVAATNATLAALGGGAIAAGGGGIALGTTILGVSTLGIGLLIGGVVFSIAGNSVSEKADKAYDQMKDEEKIIDELCLYLGDLEGVAKKYLSSLQNVNRRYQKWLSSLKATISSGKTDWNEFSQEERLNAENTILSVGLLYEMCKVKLVLTAKTETEKNKINYTDTNEAMAKAVTFLEAKGEPLEAKGETVKDDKKTVVNLANIIEEYKKIETQTELKKQLYGSESYVPEQDIALELYKIESDRLKVNTKILTLRNFDGKKISDDHEINKEIEQTSLKIEELLERQKKLENKF